MAYSIVDAYIKTIKIMHPAVIKQYESKITECYDAGLTLTSKGLKCLFEVDRAMKGRGLRFVRESLFITLPVLMYLYLGEGRL